MNNFKKSLATLAVAGIVTLGVALPAQATSADTTVTLEWFLPNGGSSEDVTWPQPVFNISSLPCDLFGTTYIGTYSYSTSDEIAQVNALANDGVLTQGEDTAFVLSSVFRNFTTAYCDSNGPISQIVAPSEEESEIDTGETKTFEWFLPNGGSAENVTWPQPVFDKTKLPCDLFGTKQVDKYRYGTPEQKAIVDAFDDDGILSYGEDFSSVISWYYEDFTTDACVIVEPPIVVEPPVVVPPVSVTPPAVPEAKIVLANTEKQLPNTGSPEINTSPWLVLSGFLLLAGLVLAFVSNRMRTNK